MADEKFKFELADFVAIDASGEAGVISGRVEYVASDHQYLIYYQAADGRACTAWFDEWMLSKVEEDNASA